MNRANQATDAAASLDDAGPRKAVYASLVP